MSFISDIDKIILTDQTGTRTILKDIRFKLGTSKVYTILGKNGSGKSTLIKALTGLLDKYTFRIEGEVLWNDENIFNIDYNRLLKIRKSEIRYALQDLTNNFDPLKKLKYYFDNTGFDETIINEKLKSFMLPCYKDISKLYPYEISGGMAQRLSLMLALLPNPKFLILDEPTSAIDYTNINLVKLTLKEFTFNGNLALIVTHDLDFAKTVSDEIAFLDNGTLTEFKTANVFFDDSLDDYSDFIKSYKELK